MCDENTDYSHNYTCGCVTTTDGSVTNRCAEAQRLYDAAMADKSNRIKTADYAVHFEVHR